MTSKDGTTLAYDVLGGGPPVVLIGGSLMTRHGWHGPVANALAAELTVFNYDRRGRGDSGDTAPYAVEREIEDLSALVEAAGGEAALCGSSSGAALALEAAAAGLPVTKLVLWEPPYRVDPARQVSLDEVVSSYETCIAEDRRGDAVANFMRLLGLQDEVVEQMKLTPFWPEAEAIAHTLVYDARVLGDLAIPAERFAKVTLPALVLAGGADFPFMRETAAALAEMLPNGELRYLDGQGHQVDPDILGPAVVEFLS